MASKKEPLFYDDPTKAAFEEDKSKFRVVLPIAPSLFEIFKTKTIERNDIDKQLFVPTRVGDVVAL